MIPGVDIVSVGEVEEHALAVPHIHPIATFPWFASVSGYSSFAFKLNKSYSWRYTVSFIVEVRCYLSISGGFVNLFSFELNVFKNRDCLSKIADLFRSRTFSSIKRLITNAGVSWGRKWHLDMGLIRVFLFFLFDWLCILRIKSLILILILIMIVRHFYNFIISIIRLRCTKGHDKVLFKEVINISLVLDNILGKHFLSFWSRKFSKVLFSHDFLNILEVLPQVFEVFLSSFDCYFCLLHA